MSKKERRPKWVFEATSSFLTIHELVFTKRRLNRLCKLAYNEKIRFHNAFKYPLYDYERRRGMTGFEKLTVNIQPYSYAISRKNSAGALRSGSTPEVHAALAHH